MSGPRRRRLRVVAREVAGIGVRFVYDDAARDVRVELSEADIASASGLSVLRLSCIIFHWTQSLAATHPGWTVDGEKPGAASVMPCDDELVEPPDLHDLHDLDSGADDDG